MRVMGKERFCNSNTLETLLNAGRLGPASKLHFKGSGEGSEERIDLINELYPSASIILSVTHSAIEEEKKSLLFKSVPRLLQSLFQRHCAVTSVASL